VKSYVYRIRVMPLKDVLDTQGRAVEETLRRMGLNVESVRVGKSIDVEIPAASRDEGKKQAQKIAQDLLANPLIETFSVDEVHA